MRALAYRGDMSNGSQTQIELRSGELWKTRTSSQPVRVSCERGAVWLTHEREGRDIVLTAGQGFVVARAGLAVVQPLEPSTIRVCEEEEE